MPRRILVTFVFILASVFGYLYFRLLSPLYVWPGVFWPFVGLMVFSILSVIWLPLFYWSSESTEVRPGEILFERFAHVSMGLLSFFLFLTLGRDLILLVLALFGNTSLLSSPSVSLYVTGLALLLGAIGFLNARRGPIVRRISLPKESTETRFRIVQISDLHVGSWIGRAYVEKVVSQIADLGPIDLVALTGDIGDGDPSRHVYDLAPLGNLKARVGKFSVTGNHEGYWNESEWNRLIRDLGFQVLENEGVELATPEGKITVHGVTDIHSDPKRALASIRPEIFSLFLSHQPKHAEAAIHANVSLQLSGHTHSGQFLPWSLFIGFARRFASGLYQVGKTTIYVNPGTGFWGPPFRLGTRSEITLIEVDPFNSLREIANSVEKAE